MRAGERRSSYRVLMIAQEYPEGKSQKGIWAEEQARAVSVMHPTRVIRAVPGKARLSPSISLCHRNGVPVAASYYVQPRKSWWLPYVAAITFAVISQRRDFPADLLHAHMGVPTGWATVVAGKILRMPVVVTEHWGCISERFNQGGLSARALRFAVQQANDWIAVSRALAAEFDTFGWRPPVRVVGNVLNPEFHTAPIEDPPASRKLRMLFVARLDSQAKGLDVLLNAMSLLRGTSIRLPVSLTVMGDGPARGSFEDAVIRYGLAHDVVFTGWGAPDEVRRQLAQADCFVMPSDYETFGMAFVEAMACGRPVIGCSVGAVPEIVPEWGGILVPPRDPHSLAAAIESMSRGVGSYDRLQLARYARELCCPDRFRSEITEAYDEAVQHFQHRVQ